MQYRLRTLLILLAVGPPALAALWPVVKQSLWPPIPIAADSHVLENINFIVRSPIDFSRITPPLIILEEEDGALGIELPDE